jgi:hypothetical protein
MKMRMTGIMGMMFASFLLCGAGQISGAEVSGSFTNEFGSTVSLWDLSGTYSESFGGINTHYTLSMDPSGKFTGQGTATANDVEGYSVDMDLGLSFTGSASTSGKLTRVNMTMKMAGSGTIEGYDCTFKATVTEKLEIDAESRTLVGTVSGKVTARIPDLHRSGSASIPKTSINTSLPGDADGTWTLDVTSNATNKNKCVGSGTITLSNDRQIPVLLSGSYAPKTDQTKLTLKGTGVNKSVTLSIAAVNTNAQMIIKQLTGKAMGQSLKLTVK